jgi:hypothetical protein
MLDYKQYLVAGFRFFGIHGVTNGVCDCMREDCEAQYKHPRMNSWQYTPYRWSDEQLEVMEMTGQFDTGIGVLVDDHLIIDIDPRNGGLMGYDELCHDTGLDFEELSGFVVRTGGDGLHIYFKREKGQALVSHLKQYQGIDFKSSGFVVGAGSKHKSGNKYEVIKGTPSDIGDPPQELIDLLKKPEMVRAEYKGQHIDLDSQAIIEMLNHVDPNCGYDEWIKVGMAIHHGTNGTGFELWDEWSAKGETYPGSKKLDFHWHSFGKSANPVTIGTLIHMATEAGYIESVTFESDINIEPLKVNESSEVDLLRPPGFVGDVAAWIRDQCRFPREHLAVAAALSAIGNIAALGYVDKTYGATTNQFIFCVAGSATGKEAIQQAQGAIHRAVDMAKCTHGDIKSDVEIGRNLIEHQAAFYTIDELGLILGKIANAGKSGATYLEGVIASLMSIYSKANGVLQVKGDVKRELRREIEAKINSLLDSGENDDKLGELEKRLNDAEMGIVKPFLSLIGYTTPITFDALVTREMATNGFFGRSLIIHEKETNPKPNENFNEHDIPFGMAATLNAIAWRGNADQHRDRIEEYAERTEIKTTDEAKSMLADIAQYYWKEAEKAKLDTLEAIPRRCFEMVLKVSMILAIPTGIRTEEHVNWANAFVKRDMENKLNLVAGNIAEELKRHDEAIARKVLGMLDKEIPLTTGVICNRCSKYKKDDVVSILEALKTKNLIRSKENTSGRKKTTNWYLS